jgi:hypothetical protein
MVDGSKLSIFPPLGQNQVEQFKSGYVSLTGTRSEKLVGLNAGVLRPVEGATTALQTCEELLAVFQCPFFPSVPVVSHVNGCYGPTRHCTSVGAPGIGVFAIVMHSSCEGDTVMIRLCAPRKDAE